MTNQRTVNASIIFHNHALKLCLTVLYVGSVVPVNEHRLVRVDHYHRRRMKYIELNWVADIRRYNQTRLIGNIAHLFNK